MPAKTRASPAYFTPLSCVCTHACRYLSLLLCLFLSLFCSRGLRSRTAAARGWPHDRESADERSSRDAYRNTVAGAAVGLNHIKARPGISRDHKSGLRTRPSLRAKFHIQSNLIVLPRRRFMEDDL